MITTSKATISDFLPLQKLVHELNMFREKNFLRETRIFHQKENALKNILSQQDFENALYFIAFEEENPSELLGLISGSIHTRKNHTLWKLGYLEELFVCENARGKGISTLLLNALEHEFKNLGCDHMTTHTDYENISAQKFYEKSGMKKVTVEYFKEI